MESSSDDEFVILSISNTDKIEPVAKHPQTLISTTDIHDWDLSTILRYQTLHIQAHRKRLAENCSYFNGLLSGSFSDSNTDCISIQWNLEAFMSVLRCMYGCPVDITSVNFLSILEMWAMSSKLFEDIPYDLLSCGIKHPHLTVYSERHLCEALLVWLNANAGPLENLSKVENDYTFQLLRQIRTSLLPLWFTTGKRRSCYFSEIANKGLETIFRLMDIPATKGIDVLGDGSLDHLRIRLTEYSKILDLSGCPQITSAILLLSLLPPSSCMDLTLRRSIQQALINFEHLTSNQSGISLGFPPIISFEAIEEVDISMCARLNLEATIEFFSISFPSLRKLKAVHLLKFKTATLLKLVEKCPQLSEVDLTVDITPLIPAEVSIVLSNPDVTPAASKKSSIVDSYAFNVTSYHSTPSISNITRLVLEGRSDIYDSDLQHITQYCASMLYVNLKGCISVTDVGISNLIHGCVKLNSILVCDTAFGMNSVLALCSTITNVSASVAHFGKRHSDSLACQLQTLHMGGCKGVNEKYLVELISKTPKLRSLCLRGTNVVDDALYSFSGSLLETLDISDTMICGGALAHIVSRNPALKYLNARGCKNLIQHGSDIDSAEHSFSYVSGELYTELGKKCILEEIAIGWGLSFLTLEPLKPAIMSLKALTVGLGGSLDENALEILATTCPMLEKVILYFQIISDSIMTHIMMSLRHLKVLALCYCLGDISISSFKFSMPNLRKLRLERVAPWMTNNDLVVLTQNCANLAELSLLGCRLLNSDSLHIISHGWPGLISFHLEDCGQVTANGVSSLFHCRALENLLLRHNGGGMHRRFILDAASKMPMLRQVSLDLCDACEGDFDIPDYSNRYFLTTVKIARCKAQRCPSNMKSIEVRGRLVHKETLALVWNSKNLIRTVVKERL